MNLRTSIIRSITGAVKAVERYPLVIMGAILFTLVTMVRVQMDLEGDSLIYLFDCLQMSLASAISYSLISTAIIKSLKKNMLYVHISTVIVWVIFFVTLFAFSRPSTDAYTRLRVTDIATARVFIWIGICFIGYIVFSKKGSFSRSLFVFLKSLAIAILYGAVLMSGTSGVAGAVQALLYNDMSEKVYMHLSAIVGFVSFTIFIGNCPSLDLEATSIERLEIEKKPRVIELLFTYVLIPIILSLTLVLMLWVGKAVVLGDWPPFRTVMGIVTSYSIGGILLYLMVLESKSKLADTYKKLYPLLSLVILLFGLWAFIKHLTNEGFRGQEYFFTLVLSVSTIMMIVILVKKHTSQEVIPFLVMTAMVISVLPIMGHHSLPVKMEVNRLESILVEEGFLKENQLIPIDDVSEDIKVSITESIGYLAYSKDIDLPEWFDRDLRNHDTFKDTFGFEMTWPKREFGNSTYVYLSLASTAHSIKNYDYAIYLDYDKASIKGDLGVYDFEWIYDEIPRLKIYLDDKLVLDKDMDEYFKILGSNERYDRRGTLEEMSYQIKEENLEIMIVFQNVSLRMDENKDYYAEIKVIYMSE